MSEQSGAPRSDLLVWIDLEMTGLEPDKERIIEVATLITDAQLNVVAEGPVIAVKQPDSLLAGMDDWNQKTHGESGLVARVKASTIETKEAHYWSRSRKKIWRKGQVSGFIQKVKEIRIDDDQDSIWLIVDIGEGASCHVGYRSCFYRSIPLGPIKNGKEIKMKFEEQEKTFDPEIVYKNQPNPTKI